LEKVLDADNSIWYDYVEMTEHSLFVDFMYAVAVGAALPRINESHFSARDPQFWGLWFFIAVFLEDFYLYHAKVLPLLKESFPSPGGFTITMLIVITWYVAQASFPSHPKWFLRSFGAFFGLKLLGSIMLSGSIHVGPNWAFVIPITVAITLSYQTKKPFFASRWHLLCFLIPTWLTAVVLWWGVGYCLSRGAH